MKDSRPVNHDQTDPVADLDAEQVYEEFEQGWSTMSLSQLIGLVAAWPEEGRATLACELVRIDLELRTRAGLQPKLEDYRQQFEWLWRDLNFRSAVAFEHFRLELEAGRKADPDEYRQRYGVDTTGWPVPSSAGEQPAVAGIVRDSGHSRLEPAALEPAARDPDGFPVVPGLFAGHELVGVLGEGAFSRVFLARQGDLARRFVTLKVTREASDEPDCLARLQHTGIVPIYSVHREGPLQAICMPFLGSLTLADLVSQMPREGIKAASGRELVSTAAARWLETRRDRGGPASVSAIALAREAARPPRVQRADGLGSSPAGQVRVEDRFVALGDRSFGETAAWLFRQLAEGLEHAHGQGIVHGDIKPANILIADDGHPLLLDFNLARKSGAGAAGIVGGTLAYMAPEQLRGYDHGLGGDERSDLYSLGLVMHELLAGRRAFPDRSGTMTEVIATMVSDRSGQPPSLEEVRPAIDHDLGQIVGKCLESDPGRRYPSAAALVEDLRRREAFLPLLTAKDRSPWHRVRKWTRRHPRVASLGSVITLAAVLLAAALAGLFARQSRLDQIAAMDSSSEFVRVLRKDQLPLTGIGVPESMVNRALLQVRETLAGYDAMAPDQLENATRFKLLPDAQKETERRAATTAWHLIEATGGPSAESAVWQKKAGSDADDLDFWILATEDLRSREFGRAATGFEAWLNDHPDDAGGWLQLGNALAGMRELADAEAAYRMCLKLDDSIEVAWFNLGRAYQDRGEGEQAINAFSAAIGINPLEPASYANRGQLRLASGDSQGAISDLGEAIELGAADTRVWYYLARAHRAVGNEADATRAAQRFLDEEPASADGWALRGFVRHQSGDLDGALNDYGRALELEPALQTALQNRANIFAEQKNQPADAIADMDRIVATRRRDPLPLVTRGVLHARMGERAKAHADAEAALQLSQTGDTLYRAAGIYAQTSLSEPADRERAIALIAAALLRDPATVEKYWADDRDLKPLADDQELQKLKAWVAEMHAMSSPNQ